MTGDVSEDGSIESYELAIDEIKNFKKIFILYTEIMMIKKI